MDRKPTSDPASTGNDPSSVAAQNLNEQLYVDVYSELRRIAAKIMRSERPDHTFQPTELVHEAYVKVADIHRVADRTHILRLAARAMRRILVDHARRKATSKRAGGWRRITLDSRLQISAQPECDTLALHEALEKLEKSSERMARVVELRVFAGMTARETAEALGVSKRTVDNDWKVARARLAHEMSS